MRAPGLVRSHLSALYRGLLVILLSCALVLCVALLVFWLRNTDIAPEWDMVSTVYFLLGGDSGVAPGLLSSDIWHFVDNEHRPVLPMFVWAADLKLFASRGYLPQALILLFAVCIAFLCTSWSRQRGQPTLAAATVTACACALMLAPMHYENLMYPKQVHVMTSILLSLAAFRVALAIPGARRRTQFLRGIGASALAFGATFSFGYGLVVWPILLLHGAICRWPVRGYAVIALSAALTIGLYYSLYTVLPHHSDPRATVFDPVSLVAYAARFLPAALGRWDPAMLVPVGLGMFLILGVAAVRYYVLGQRKGDGRALSLMICGYAAGIAVLTALGRVGINFGNDSRYLVVSGLFLLAAPGLFGAGQRDRGGAGGGGAGGGGAGGGGAVIVAALFLMVALSSWFIYKNDIQYRKMLIKDGVIAAAMQVQPVYRGLSPSARMVDDVVWPFYAAAHLGRGPLEVIDWLGKPLPGSMVAEPSAGQDRECRGYVDRIDVRPEETGVSVVVGWARMGSRGERAAPWVLVTDGRGILKGLAATGVVRPDVSGALESSWLERQFAAADTAGFEGLARAMPGDMLNFYAYANGRACRFATGITVPKR